MCGTLVGDSGSGGDGGQDSCRSIFNVIPQTAAFSLPVPSFLPSLCRIGLWDIIQFGSDSSSPPPLPPHRIVLSSLRVRALMHVAEKKERKKKRRIH